MAGYIEEKTGRYREILKLTEKMRGLVSLKEYDKLTDLLNERQNVLMEIQGFDAVGPAPHLKEDGGEVSHIVEKIVEIDREIRLRIACEMDETLCELKAIGKKRSLLKAYL